MYFSTDEFEFSHGKKPKGRGTWCFGASASDTEVFAPYNLTLGEAKKWFKSQYPECKGEVVVLP
jgi:hypothetical protein